MTKRETLHLGDERLSSESKNMGSWLQNFSSKTSDQDEFTGNAFVDKENPFQTAFSCSSGTFYAIVWITMVCIFAFLGV